MVVSVESGSFEVSECTWYSLIIDNEYIVPKN